MRILLILLMFTLFLFADGKIIDTKRVNGIKYNIIKSNAYIMAVYKANSNKFLGRDLVFKNLNGKNAFSNISQKELEKFNINDKVTIYYALRDKEEDKQSYKVFFDKKKLIKSLLTTPQTKGQNDLVDDSKISKESISSIISKKPLTKLVYEDNSYKYVPSVSIWKTIFLVLFIGSITLLFLISFNILGVIIGLMMLGMSYFMLVVVPSSEKKVFDMKTKEFYSGDTKDDPSNQTSIKFDDIYAFQILKHNECIIKSRNRECFDAYSLNMVLKNYERHNIITHGDYTSILADADRLSKALGKPVLNQIDKN